MGGDSFANVSCGILLCSPLCGKHRVWHLATFPFVWFLVLLCSRLCGLLSCCAPVCVVCCLVVLQFAWFSVASCYVPVCVVCCLVVLPFVLLCVAILDQAFVFLG